MNTLTRKLNRLIEKRKASSSVAAAARYEVLQRTRAAFTAVAKDFPPTDLVKLAASLGVRTVRASPLATDGRLIRSGPDLVIELNNSHSKARQRFSLAHEIGHLIVAQNGGFLATTVKERVSAPFAPDPNEEYLCNLAATDLLIPSEWVQDFLISRRLSLTTISQIARICETSLEVAARRAVDLSTQSGRLIWWRKTERRWRPYRAHPSYRPETLVWLEIVETEGNLLEAVFQNRRSTTGFQLLQIEGATERFNVEVWNGSEQDTVVMLLREGRSRGELMNRTLF